MKQARGDERTPRGRARRDARFTVEDLGALLDWGARKVVVGDACRRGWMRGDGGEALRELLASAKGGI